MAGSLGQADDLQYRATTFFALSDALSLDQAEEQAMLDLPAADMQRLLTAPAEALRRGGPKLQRRLDYAIPLLTRMLASISS